MSQFRRTRLTSPPHRGTTYRVLKGPQCIPRAAPRLEERSIRPSSGRNCWRNESNQARLPQRHSPTDVRSFPLRHAAKLRRQLYGAAPDVPCELTLRPSQGTCPRFACAGSSDVAASARRMHCARPSPSVGSAASVVGRKSGVTGSAHTISAVAFLIVDRLASASPTRQNCLLDKGHREPDLTPTC